MMVAATVQIRALARGAEMHPVLFNKFKPLTYVSGFFMHLLQTWQ